MGLEVEEKGVVQSYRNDKLSHCFINKITFVTKSKPFWRVFQHPMCVSHHP